MSELDRGDRFEVLDGSVMLSTGLNVVLGERSSGKSYTLDRIAEEFDGNAKYIKQFELLEKDTEASEKKFAEYLNNNNSLSIQNYLKELKDCVDQVAAIDLEKTDHKVNAYIESLLQSARETEREDAFSKVPLFSENLFQIVGIENLKNLIESSLVLLSTSEYRSIIDKFISHDNLIPLLEDFVSKYREENEKIRRTTMANELISIIKSALALKTSATLIPEIDFYSIAMERAKISKFCRVATLVKQERIISKKPLQSFYILEEARPFRSIQEMKTMSGTRTGSFVLAYEKYSDPYDFLIELRNIGVVPASDYYRYFAVVSYRVLNKYMFDVSGGERSEFRLLQEISDANQSDILLIDEPESSFDNLFLKNDVNGIIKDLSRKLPVVIVTHNNTVIADGKLPELADESLPVPVQK